MQNISIRKIPGHLKLPERQVKEMLMWEGVFYTTGVLILTLTAGGGITYAIYQTMNYMGAEFWFSVLPFVGATAILLGICIAVPVMAYQKIEKSGSLIERIRLTVG